MRLDELVRLRTEYAAEGKTNIAGFLDGLINDTRSPLDGLENAVASDWSAAGRDRANATSVRVRLGLEQPADYGIAPRNRRPAHLPRRLIAPADARLRRPNAGAKVANGAAGED